MIYCLIVKLRDFELKHRCRGCLVFGCDSLRSPNVSVFVCQSFYNCTKALSFKVFRLKDF